MSDMIVPVALPTLKPADEEYATFEQLDQSDDLIEVDIRLDWWKDARGRPRCLRVRALSAEDEAMIELAGRRAAADFKRQTGDWSAPDRFRFAEDVSVLEFGVVHPKLSREQAEQLLKRNARAIEELVRFIRSLNGQDRMSLALVASQFDVFLPGTTTQEEASEPGTGTVAVSA